jgi:CheY-like chemotaxis protein
MTMGDKTKIMVVDDTPTNLKLACDLLDIEGFEVRGCINAETALEALREFHPALILMDVALPGIDGLQLTRKLKSEDKTRSIKIVALTAFAMKSDREKVLQAGCDGYITKPIDTRKFREQIMQFII